MKTNQINKNKKAGLAVKFGFIALLMAALSVALFACNGGGNGGVAELSIYQNPNRMEFLIGHHLDVSGGLLEIRARDGSTRTISMGAVGVERSHTVLDTIGDTTVTLTYSGRSITFTVAVRPNTTGIAVAAQPTNVPVVEGMPLNLEGGTVTLTNQGSANETISMTSDRLEVIQGALNQGVMPVTLRLRINTSVSTTFNVGVTSLAVVDIAGFTAPTQTTRNVGHPLSTILQGGSVEAIFNNPYYNATIPMTDQRFANLFTVSGFANIPGTHNVRITANGNEAAFRVFNMTLNPATPVRIEFAADVTAGIIARQGYPINFGTAEATIVYTVAGVEVRAQELLSNTAAFTVSGYNSGVAGAQTLTITLNYGETPISNTLAITVATNPIATLRIASYPTIRTFYRMQPLNLSGGYIELTYASGRVENRPMADDMFTISGGGTATVGANITINILLTAQPDRGIPFQIAVLANPVAAVEIVRGPNTTVYNALNTAPANLASLAALNGLNVRVVLTHPAASPAFEEFNVTNAAAFTAFNNNFTISGFDPLPEAGAAQRQQIRVTHTASTLISANYFTIDILLPTIMALTPPTRTAYNTGESLNIAGANLDIIFTHPHLDDVILENVPIIQAAFTLSGFNSFPEDTGQQRITLAWAGANISAYFYVTVAARVISGLEVIRLPGVYTGPADDRVFSSEVVYFLGQHMNLNGGIVRISYECGYYTDVAMTSNAFTFTATGITVTQQGAAAFTSAGTQTITIRHANTDIEFAAPFHVFVFSQNPIALVTSVYRALNFPWMTPQNNFTAQFSHYLDAAFLAIYLTELRAFVEAYQDLDQFPAPINSFDIAIAVTEFLDMFFREGQMIGIQTGGTSQSPTGVNRYIADIMEQAEEDYYTRVERWLERGGDDLKEFWEFYLDIVRSFRTDIFLTEPNFGMHMWNAFLELTNTEQFYFLNLIHSVPGFEFGYFNFNQEGQPTSIRFTILGSSLLNEFAFILQSKANAQWPPSFNAQNQPVQTQNDGIRLAFTEMLRATEFLIVHTYWATYGPDHLESYLEEPLTEEELEFELILFFIGLSNQLNLVLTRFTHQQNGGLVQNIVVMTTAQRQIFNARFGPHVEFLVVENNRIVAEMED